MVRHRPQTSSAFAMSCAPCPHNKFLKLRASDLAMTTKPDDPSSIFNISKMSKKCAVTLEQQSKILRVFY